MYACVLGRCSRLSCPASPTLHPPNSGFCLLVEECPLPRVARPLGCPPQKAVSLTWLKDHLQDPRTSRTSIEQGLGKGGQSIQGDEIVSWNPFLF